jgi:hypothetical protein
VVSRSPGFIYFHVPTSNACFHPPIHPLCEPIPFFQMPSLPKIPSLRKTTHTTLPSSKPPPLPQKPSLPQNPSRPQYPP